MDCDHYQVRSGTQIVNHLRGSNHQMWSIDLPNDSDHCPQNIAMTRTFSLAPFGHTSQFNEQMYLARLSVLDLLISRGRLQLTFMTVFLVMHRLYSSVWVPKSASWFGHDFTSQIYYHVKKIGWNECMSFLMPSVESFALVAVAMFLDMLSLVRQSNSIVNQDPTYSWDPLVVLQQIACGSTGTFR